MSCFHPLTAYQLRMLNANGRRSIVFSPSHPAEKSLLMLPCGQCIGCRIDKAKGNALRCCHEAKQWSHNSFLTLTYDDANLPANRSLHYPDFQKFMKRLRAHLDYTFGIKRIAFYMCGEYGDKTWRPHYHVILFGYDFSSDRVQVATKRGNAIFKSPTLTKLWGKGHADIGSVTYQSASYVARYVMKKMTGERAKDHYKRVDSDTGEIYHLTPEFQKMSLRPSIGKGFFDEYSSDIYPDDFCLIEGKKVRTPRYYDNLLERTNPTLLETVKKARKAKAVLYEKHTTKPRRAAREAVLDSKISKLKRELE